MDIIALTRRRTATAKHMEVAAREVARRSAGALGPALRPRLHTRTDRARSDIGSGHWRAVAGRRADRRRLVASGQSGRGDHDFALQWTWILSGITQRLT